MVFLSNERRTIKKQYVYIVVCSKFYWSFISEHMAQLVEHETRDRRSHCVVSKSKTLYLMLSTGSTEEDPSKMTDK